MANFYTENCMKGNDYINAKYLYEGNRLYRRITFKEKKLI